MNIKIKLAIFFGISLILGRIFIFEIYSLPTPSMSATLKVGDIVMVNKVMILDPVERKDIVVFTYPEDEKTPYIKRCIGISGDKFEIKNQNIYINGETVVNPKNSQQSYKLYLKEVINKKTLLKWNITDQAYPSQDGSLIVNTTIENAKKLSENSIVSKIVLNEYTEPDLGVIPNSSIVSWNKDNMGPIWIPKAGETIELTPLNIVLYEKIIRKFEDNIKVQLKDNKIWVNDKKVDHYTFKQDYYFMMGDNRHNSLDSRYWGFVPSSYILGKVKFVLFSFDENKNGFKKIRKDRIFSSIH